MTNRLAGETSPYLRQHMDNPVDWYPWGEEAFDLARRENKPVMLSIGYSSCHWCHVMAHESFEDETIASLLNRRFVSVKVDREERPDIDAIYMEAVQALTGRGGWPMTVFLTPDGRPFFGGTYFPKQRASGLPGFEDLLVAVDEAWKNQRTKLDAQADQLANAIRARTALPADSRAGNELFSPEIMERAFSAARDLHDDSWGGFGSAPKFPQAALLELVMREFLHKNAAESLGTTTTTLDAMASGGIYDHLGGGFARYSVDRYWMVPHFEKMLYDQASLVRTYLHGWQVCHEARWLQVVEETIGYVLRELRHPAGGICSSEDADSEGVEGRFYLWSIAEVADVLGPDLAQKAAEWYGVTEEGNFEHLNILHRPVRGELIRPPEIEEARMRLYEARCKRPRPGLDDKIITEWNAMFCSALAEAAAATGRKDWTEAAASVASFLLEELYQEGRWRRSWREGQASQLACAADYAWLVDAFTHLGELTGEASWVRRAIEVAEAMLALFWDHETGSFFTTGGDAEKLIVRSRELFDGATPSANAVAAIAMVRLGALTGRSKYRDRAREVLAMLGRNLIEHPTAFAHALSALDLVVRGTTEIAVVGHRPEMVKEVQRRYLPYAVLAWGEPFDSPLWAGREPGKAYVCQDYTCTAPSSDLSELRGALSKL